MVIGAVQPRPSPSVGVPGAPTPCQPSPSEGVPLPARGECPVRALGCPPQCGEGSRHPYPTRPPFWLSAGLIDGCVLQPICPFGYTGENKTRNPSAEGRGALKLAPVGGRGRGQGALIPSHGLCLGVRHGGLNLLAHGGQCGLWCTCYGMSVPHSVQDDSTVGRVD